MPFRLDEVRTFLLSYFESLQDTGGRYGAYRAGPRLRTDLYASLDVALMRAIMGENLLALPEKQRAEWTDHINSFAESTHNQPITGCYGDTHGHSKLHANGMVIGALGVIGGKMRHPLTLYDGFNSPEKVAGWLETIDWARQWSASHLFWGGMHCFSFSARCTPEWFDAVFAWLNANVDEKTGWWRKGVPHSDRHQPLGGSVHIVPIYEHHGRAFPYPERVIDSVLAMQLPNGYWLQHNGAPYVTYLELDALYAYRVMQTWAPNYRRDDVMKSVDRFGTCVIEYFNQKRDMIAAHHPHLVLGLVGTFGLLQHLQPDRFVDSVKWSDIFSDRQLYRTKEVEVF